MGEVMIANPEDWQKFVGWTIVGLTVQTVNNDPVLILLLSHPAAEKKVRLILTPAVTFGRAASGFLVEHGTPLLVAMQLKLRVEDVL